MGLRGPGSNPKPARLRRHLRRPRRERAPQPPKPPQPEPAHKTADKAAAEKAADKVARNRAAVARCAARKRAGIAVAREVLYSAAELDMLVGLGWLAESDAGTQKAVSRAITALRMAVVLQ